MTLTHHVRNFYGEQQISLSGLAPEIFGLEDRRLIYLATRTIELGIEIHSLKPGDDLCALILESMAPIKPDKNILING